MIQSKIVRKLFTTTMSMFIILIVFSISVIGYDEVIPSSLELEEVSSISTNSIYLMNKNGYLVKSNILLDNDKIEEKVWKFLNNLIVSDANKFSNGLSGVIPKDVSINNVIYGSNIVTVDFSKEFYNIDYSLERKVLQAVVYSILDIKGVEGVCILVDGVNLEKSVNTNEIYPNVFDKSIGINEIYNLKYRNDITKVVVYYLENIDDNIYYVPVTKYVNDDRDKILVIIDELTSSYIYEDNLMSLVNSNLELINYREENDCLFLNFNDYLFDSDDKVLEEVIYSIGYSVMDNYNVSMVMFEVNGKEVDFFERKQGN